jgi:hypothetical protein
VTGGSALECAAILDAMTALGIHDTHIPDADALLVRIVSMLTKMIARQEPHTLTLTGSTQPNTIEVGCSGIARDELLDLRARHGQMARSFFIDPPKCVEILRISQVT